MEGCENLGFPIAELAHDGSCVITKEANTGGEVSAYHIPYAEAGGGLGYVLN
jgi:hypothetical protein